MKAEPWTFVKDKRSGLAQRNVDAGAVFFWCINTFHCRVGPGGVNNPLNKWEILNGVEIFFYDERVSSVMK